MTPDKTSPPKRKSSRPTKTTPPRKTMAKKGAAKPKAPRGEQVFPRPGTLKAKAAEHFRTGESATEAATALKGKPGTFSSWWRQFKARLGPQPKAA